MHVSVRPYLGLQLHLPHTDDASDNDENQPSPELPTALSIPNAPYPVPERAIESRL